MGGKKVSIKDMLSEDKKLKVSSMGRKNIINIPPSINIQPGDEVVDIVVIKKGKSEA